ncbi:MAG: glycosyltransferase family 1 protein [Proteobacteria bacterium]|nr:glycosyltransferase family 1 protein [Pseudomonadota bacterium]
MRILTVVESPSWVEHHVVGSLVRLGHDVKQFSYGSSVGEYYGRARRDCREKKNQALVDLVRTLKRAGGLDLIFCYVYDDFLTVEHARQLAALGIPMVNYNVDMLNQWYRQIRTARFFTRVLCAQRINMDNLARYGATVVHFPMAAPPPRPGANAGDFRPSAPVTFLGAPTAYRLRALGALKAHGVPLAVYGKSWDQVREVGPDYSFEKTISDIRHYAGPRLRGEGFGSLSDALLSRLKKRRDESSIAQARTILNGVASVGGLSDDAVVSLFRHSSINLGFTRMAGDDPGKPGKTQIKLRDFEVPMAGGFYLVEEAPGYDEHFIPGREVETWRTQAELEDKIRYYLQHEDERTMIAEAGRRRALAQHTWAHRFEMLFRVLSIG